MAGGTTPRHVAERYEGLIDGIVIDTSDSPAEAGVATIVTSTLMTDLGAARRLAGVALEAAA